MNTIMPDELRQKIENKENIILLDVRTTEEFARGHIEGAINLPGHILPLRYEEVLPDKNAEIICCCFSGGRSAQAIQFLQSHGYTNLKNLMGGYMVYSRG